MIDDLGATTPRLTTLCVVDDGLITASMIKRMVFVRYNLSREYSRSTLTFSGFVTPPRPRGHPQSFMLSSHRNAAAKQLVGGRTDDLQNPSFADPTCAGSAANRPRPYTEPVVGRATRVESGTCGFPCLRHLASGA